MTTYTVQITWVLAGQPKQAACIGCDETVTIEAETPAEACEEAIHDALYHQLDRVDTDQYQPVAEVVEAV